MDQATTHIKQMKERVEMLKQRKQQILEGHISNADKVVSTGGSGSIIRSSLNYSIMGNKIFYTSHAEVFIYVAMYDNWLLVILRKNVRERKVE